MIDIMKIPCPFCKEKTISMIHRQKSYGYHYGRAGSNRKMMPKLNPEKYGILTSKCSNCKKPIKEIMPLLKKEGWI